MLYRDLPDRRHEHRPRVDQVAGLR